MINWFLVCRMFATIECLLVYLAKDDALQSILKLFLAILLFFWWGQMKLEIKDHARIELRTFNPEIDCANH